jgi:putative endonuclease
VSKENLNLGRSGEELAAAFLRRKGYRILAKNFRSKLGEIDIIARQKDTVCFIEVKTRRTDRFGLPQESVLASKQRQISKAALDYLKVNKMLDIKARFDVVSVLFSDNEAKLDLIQDAFELDPRFTY